MKNKKLNFEGVDTVTNDTYYDICNGYFNREIEDDYTREELQKAINVINSLVSYLEDNDLVG